MPAGRPRTAQRITRNCGWCGVEYEHPVWEKGRKRFHRKECYWAWKNARTGPRPQPKVAGDRTCTFVDVGGVQCPKPHKGRGFCEMHLKRVRKYGDPAVVHRRGPNKGSHLPCVIDGCDGPAVGKGLCRKHYNRVYRRGGDPAIELPRGNFSTAVSARLYMFEQGSPDECWEWLGSTNKNGYGTTGLSGKSILAHRAVYTELVGPIGVDEDGNDLTLDHLCGNRLCVNPNHLEPVTAIENKIRRGGPHFELRGKRAVVTWT